MSSLTVLNPISSVNPPIVRSPKGRFQGAYYSPIKSLSTFVIEYYSCIPYAKAPMGVLRLMPAVPTSYSLPIRQCTINPFIFNDGTLDNGYHVAPGKIEDLMTNYVLDNGITASLPYNNQFREEASVMLDIMRRPNTTSNSNLPVIVSIHGGGLSATSRQTNGGPISRLLQDHDCIIVSIDYRLSILGWTPLSEFTAPPVDDTRYNPVDGVFRGMKQFAGACGNQGLTDCIVALQWVKANIAAFGGNPNNVTIWGESSGGYIIDLLQASPYCLPTGVVPNDGINNGLGQQLFHKVISNSGALSGNNSKFTNPSGNQFFYSVSAWNDATATKGRSSLLGTDATANFKCGPLSGTSLTTYMSGATPAVSAVGGWNMICYNSSYYIGVIADGVVIPFNALNILDPTKHQLTKMVDVPIIYMGNKDEQMVNFYGELIGSLADKHANPSGDLSFYNRLIPSSTEVASNQRYTGFYFQQNFGKICRLYGLEGFDVPSGPHTTSNKLGINETTNYSEFLLYHAAVVSVTLTGANITTLNVLSGGLGYGSGESVTVTIEQKINNNGNVTVTKSKTGTATLIIDPKGSGKYKVGTVTMLADDMLTGWSIVRKTAWVEITVSNPIDYNINCPRLAPVLVGQFGHPLTWNNGVIVKDQYWNQLNIMMEILNMNWYYPNFDQGLNFSGGSPSYVISMEHSLTGKLENGKNCAIFYATHALDLPLISGGWDWDEETANRIYLQFFAETFGSSTFQDYFGYPRHEFPLKYIHTTNYTSPYVPTSSDKSVNKLLLKIFADFMATGNPGFPDASTGNGLKISQDASGNDTTNINGSPISSFHDGVVGAYYNSLYGGPLNVANIALQASGVTIAINSSIISAVTTYNTTNSASRVFSSSILNTWLIGKDISEVTTQLAVTDGVLVFCVPL